MTSLTRGFSGASASRSERRAAQGRLDGQPGLRMPGRGLPEQPQRVRDQAAVLHVDLDRGPPPPAPCPGCGSGSPRRRRGPRVWPSCDSLMEIVASRPRAAIAAIASSYSSTAWVAPARSATPSPSRSRMPPMPRELSSAASRKRLLQPLAGHEPVRSPAGDRVLGDLPLQAWTARSPHQHSVDHHASRSGLAGVQMATATVSQTLLKRDLAHIRSRPRRRESESAVEATTAGTPNPASRPAVRLIATEKFWASVHARGCPRGLEHWRGLCRSPASVWAVFRVRVSRSAACDDVVCRG